MLMWLTLRFYDFCGFRSVTVNIVFLGLLRVDLITLVGLKCLSVRPQKVSSILMKFGM